MKLRSGRKQLLFSPEDLAEVYTALGEVIYQEHQYFIQNKFSDENKSPPSSQQSKDIQAASPQRASRKKETLKQIVAETLKRPLFTEMNQGSERNGSWSLDRRRETDEYDAYGITVAAKLRRMNESQRLYCEKIINEALFKAALEQLTPLSEIVICIPTTHDT